MIVLVSDGSFIFVRVTVIINVIDVNDNFFNIDLRYIISFINGIVYLFEKDFVNIKIVLIIVLDKDIDVNGKVICFIEREVLFYLKVVYDN